jgi:hypothetical protein
MVRRHAIKSMEEQRSRIVAALYSNPNWDQKEANRGDIIKQISAQFNEAMELVYSSKEEVRRRKEADIDWNNPFWQAAKRAQDRLKQRFGLAESTQEDREQVAALTEDQLAQLEVRNRSRREIDQL